MIRRKVIGNFLSDFLFRLNICDVMIPYLTDTLCTLLILAVTSRVDVQDATIASSAATTAALGERLNDQSDEIQDLKSGMFHFHQLQLFVTSLLRQLSNTEMIIKYVI